MTAAHDVSHLRCQERGNRWNARKALSCMGNASIGRTGREEKPSAAAAAFDGSAKPRGLGCFPGSDRGSSAGRVSALQACFRRVSGVLTTDAVSPHSSPQGAGVETNDERRPVFPLDSPTGFLEHLEYVVTFHLAKR